ncbi:MAG: hypothetical protein P8P66_08485, partial [Paracoccaceae bacterium]|nr:hypothetical protein [Paracoccaceae bacterium]
MLWRNFPEADNRAGAQHFATLDDRNADETVNHNLIMNDCFPFLPIGADYSAAITSSASPNPRG